MNSFFQTDTLFSYLLSPMLIIIIIWSIFLFIYEQQLMYSYKIFFYISNNN